MRSVLPAGVHGILFDLFISVCLSFQLGFEEHFVVYLYQCVCPFRWGPWNDLWPIYISVSVGPSGFYGILCDLSKSACLSFQLGFMEHFMAYLYQCVCPSSWGPVNTSWPIYISVSVLPAGVRGTLCGLFISVCLSFQLGSVEHFVACLYQCVCL